MKWFRSLITFFLVTWGKKNKKRRKKTGEKKTKHESMKLPWHPQRRANWSSIEGLLRITKLLVALAPSLARTSALILPSQKYDKVAWSNPWPRIDELSQSCFHNDDI